MPPVSPAGAQKDVAFPMGANGRVFGGYASDCFDANKSGRSFGSQKSFLFS